MNYKIEGAIRRNRKNFIIYAILWVVIALVFVSPFSYSAHVAGLDGEFNLEIFITTFGQSITNPFATLGALFTNGAVGNFISTLLVVTIFYTVFFFIGFVRTAPKNEFTKSKGIILAEDNYLPLDKRGNINVLVVGRFWFW